MKCNLIYFRNIYQIATKRKKQVTKIILSEENNKILLWKEEKYINLLCMTRFLSDELESFSPDYYQHNEYIYTKRKQINKKHLLIYSDRSMLSNGSQWYWTISAIRYSTRDRISHSLRRNFKPLSIQRWNIF